MDAAPRFPWVTAAICVPSVLLLVMARLGWPAAMGIDVGPGADLGDALTVVELGARSTALVGDAEERWRLLSAHFVHTSWTHLVFNLAFLFPTGGALEQVLRRSDYAILVLLAMVGSATSSLLLTPQVSAGASGIVFAVLTAAVITGVRHRDRLGPRVRHHFGVWVLPFLLVILAITIGNPSVDHASHTGGLLIALMYAPFMRLRLPEPIERSSPANTMALAACSLALLAAPAIARGGAPERVVLAGGWSADLPAAWSSRYGVHGEREWSAAGGFVVLTTGDAPRGSDVALRRWYLDHRILPLGATERGHGPQELLAIDTPALPAGALQLRFALRREQTPMVRDVYFLPGPAGTDRTTVVSLEVPLAWAGRYDATRRSLLGSLRPSRPGAPGLTDPQVTPVSVAAIE
ncbi:MAG: rhomboid family intramembrane serine protease [Deltaproteobacteria bacterium]|nr:rhomboid family intramembrane serine protease [Nannocystaceae bacterium]